MVVGGDLESGVWTVSVVCGRAHDWEAENRGDSRYVVADGGDNETVRAIDTRHSIILEYCNRIPIKKLRIIEMKEKAIEMGRVS